MRVLSIRSSHPYRSENEAQTVPLMEKSEDPKEPFSWIRFLQTIVLCFLALEIIFGMIYAIWSKTRPDINCNCGSSLEEAIFRNCKWDSLASAWLPEHCQDEELLKEFETTGPYGSWTYYADPDGNTTLTADEISLCKTGAQYWTTRRWHIMHCTFYWRKQMRSASTGVRVEGRYNEIHHLEHCEKLFLERGPLDEIIFENAVTFLSDGKWIPVN